MLVYTSPLLHRAAVEMAARHHIVAVVEKPFSTTLEDALAMQRAAREYHTTAPSEANSPLATLPPADPSQGRTLEQVEQELAEERALRENIHA